MESCFLDKGPYGSAKPYCFSCGRRIRQWETGYVDTGLCEDCQVEAEEQAARDDAACQEVYEGEGNQ